MAPKEIQFITFLTSITILCSAFYFIGTYILKPTTNKSKNIMVFVLIGIVFCVVTINWLFLEWNPILGGICSGLSGIPLGFMASQAKKFEKKND